MYFWRFFMDVDKIKDCLDVSLSDRVLNLNFDFSGTDNIVDAHDLKMVLDPYKYGSSVYYGFVENNEYLFDDIVIDFKSDAPIQLQGDASYLFGFDATCCRTSTPVARIFDERHYEHFDTCCMFDVRGCENFDTSGVINMSGMFSDCSSGKFNPNLRYFNTSNVIDMHGMFFGCDGDVFNPDVSQWDTSSVENMSVMFSYCSGDMFNPDVTYWDVSNVYNMSRMFEYCGGYEFNPDVSKWDTSNVGNMNDLFRVCDGAEFSPDVKDWNTSKVTDMHGMFCYCDGGSFSVDVSDWDTSSVKDMSEMFHGVFVDYSGCCEGDFVKNWNVSNVENMRDMFSGCTGDEFNPDISAWDVSNVKDMSGMFEDCCGDDFCPNIDNWDTSNVENMNEMFRDCNGKSFVAPDFSKLDLSSLDDAERIFYGATLSDDDALGHILADLRYQGDNECDNINLMDKNGKVISVKPSYFQDGMLSVSWDETSGYKPGNKWMYLDEVKSRAEEAQKVVPFDKSKVKDVSRVHVYGGIEFEDEQDTLGL